MTNLLGIDNIIFDVDDLAQAKAHYERIGLTEKFTVVESGITGYGIGDERPGLLLRVVPGTKRSGPRGPRLWIEVPDARAHVATFGPDTPVIGPAMAVRTGWVVEVADPWGNVVGFTDYAFEHTRSRMTERE